jgi:hypothetical protein
MIFAKLFIVAASIIYASDLTAEERIFLDWCKANGVEGMDSFRWPVYFDSTGRGVEALRDVGENDTLVRVPLSLSIHKNSAPEYSELLQEIPSELQKLDAIVLLERAKGANSFWYPFFLSFPKDYSNDPEWWSNEDLMELQHQYFFDTVRVDTAWYEKFYKEFLALLDRFQIPMELSYEEYLWATRAVYTRNSDFELNGEFIHILVPFIDLLNHHANSGTRWRTSEDSFFEMFNTYGIIQQGEQAFTNSNQAGDNSNFRSLHDYGYITLDNDLNCETLGSSERKLCFLVEPDWVMQVFRPIDTSDMDEETIRGVTIRNCVDEIFDELGSLPTTLERDLELLDEASSQIGKNNRFILALKYRIGRKQALMENYYFCREIWDQDYDYHAAADEL